MIDADSGIPPHFRFSSLKTCTVNVTGETVVPNKNFPNKKQRFSLHKAGKVGKIGDFPSIKQGLSQNRAGEILF